MSFDGKVVLVTGSSSGIGEEIAFQFAKAGASVVITGRHVDRIASVVEKCKAASKNANAKMHGVKCDVKKDSELRNLAAEVTTTFGGLDVLVNNAGISTFALFTEPNAIDQFDVVMKTNLRAPFLLTHLLTPLLIKAKGNIINISSIAGLKPHSGGSMYCTVKAGLDMFSKVLSLELGPLGVRVNSVNPGVVDTPIFGAMGFGDEASEAILKQAGAMYPLRRVGKVEEIGKFVLFLASEDASFVTGLVGQIDGGAIHAVPGVLNQSE